MENIKKNKKIYILKIKKKLTENWKLTKKTEKKLKKNWKKNENLYEI